MIGLLDGNGAIPPNAPMPNNILSIAAPPDIPVEPSSIANMMKDAHGWMTLHWANIIVASVIAGIAATILLAMTWIGARIARREPGQMITFRHVVGQALGKTKLWFVIIIAARIVSGYAHAPEDIASIVHFLFVIATALQATIYLRAIILGAIENRANEHETLGNAFGLIRLLVTAALFGVAAVLVLSNLGVNVTGLVAGLGIGGIAIGLAAQGIFSDLFAALAIIFDRPFSTGDTIRWDTTTGTVESIGLKTTRIRAQTGEQVVISNTNLLGKEIHNMARVARRRVIQTLGLIYQTPPDICDQVPALLKEIVESHDKATIIRAGFAAFGPSSIDFQLEYDIHSDDYGEVFEIRHTVNGAILRRFAKENIQFAYPTQTTFTAAPDGTLVMPYATTT